MRVLHLLDTTEDYAGTEIHLTTLVKAQIKQGIKAEIACVKGGLLHQAVVAQSLPFVLLPVGNPLRQIRSMRTLIRRKYDVVHAHNGRTRLLAVLSTSSSTAVVATQHFIETQSAMYRGVKKRLANGAHRRVNGRVAHFVAISKAARDAMIEREGVKPSKITIVPNGIESPEKPDAAQKSRLRHELGVAEDAPLLVCAARLRIEKGIHFLVAAMPAVLAAHPQVQLVVAGEGALQNELEAQAAKLNVGAAVKFLGYRDDAIALIGCADVFVLPSPAEPFGLVIIEAMAQGIAPVAARAGGPLEIIEDGVSGRLVAPGDAQYMAAALIDLLSHREKCEMLGQNALKRFDQLFTAQSMAAATLEVYQRVTKK